MASPRQERFAGGDGSGGSGREEGIRQTERGSGLGKPATGTLRGWDESGGSGREEGEDMPNGARERA